MLGPLGRGGRGGQPRVGGTVYMNDVRLVTLRRAAHRSFEGQKRDAIKGAYKDLLRAWKQGAAASPIC